MLAEHGILGGAAMIIMFAMCFRNYRRANGRINRALIGAFLVWGFLFMAHSAIRIVAAPVLMGFSFAQLSIDSDEITTAS
jgi:O-antigen ligase